MVSYEEQRNGLIIELWVFLFLKKKKTLLFKSCFMWQLHGQWVSWARPAMPANVLPALCILLLHWDDSMPSRCSHFSFTWVQRWHPSLGQRWGPEGQWANSPSLLPHSLSLSAHLRHPHFLPVSTFQAHLLSSCRQQLWTGDSGVPATRGETAKVMPARTFSSSRLSWQHDPWVEKTWESL